MKDLVPAFVGAAALLVGPVNAALGQATFTPIRNDVSPPYWSFATSVSADGSTAVGITDGYGPGWIWTEGDGFVIIGGAPLGGHVYGCSGDGTYVIGNTTDDFGITTPGIWSEADGWVSLGSFPGAQSCDNSYGSGYDISRDGTIAGGLGWANLCDGWPFRWSEALGMVIMPMQDSALHYAARVNAVSGDGLVFGGWEANDFGTWRPCVWLADGTQNFVGPDPYGTNGEVWNLNHDGSIAVGFADGHAFTWTPDDGFTPLPDPPGSFGDILGLGLSDDGRVIAGRYGDAVAVIWLDGVPHRLDEYLLDHGATGLDGFSLFNAIGVSADGTVITGTAIEGPNFVAFQATIPPLADDVCRWDCEPVGGDGVVNVDDLFGVLNNWGICADPDDCPWDCEPDGGDGFVNVDDLFGILNNWGQCAPLGACCFFDGECRDHSEFDCQVYGGVWNPNESCGDYVCEPAPSGACCLPTQECFDLTEKDCPWAGGVWFEYEQCDSFDCPPPPEGACCLWPDTECVMLSELECDQVGGMFFGEGVECLDITCPQAAPGETVLNPIMIDAIPYNGDGDTTGYVDDYNPTCPTQYDDHVAADIVYAFTPTVSVTVDIAMCAGTVPTYQPKLYVFEDTVGNVIACIDDGCDYPYSPLLTFVPMEAGHTYYIVVDGDWNQEEGYFTIDMYEAIAGACCLLDETCEDGTLTDCNLLGGVFYEGESCDSFDCPPQPLGACCFWPSGDCEDLSEWDCLQAGGAWHGEGTACIDTDCPVPGGPGDTIDTAYVIPSLPYSTAGDSTYYMNDYDEQCPFPSSTAPDVVYAYTPTVDETVTVSMCADSLFNTKLYIYENAKGNLVDCNDDACWPPQYPNGPFVSELMDVQMSAGNTYYIIVDGYGLDSGYYTLDVY